MKTLLTALYNMIATLHPAVKFVVGASSILLAFNSYMNAMWAKVFVKVDAMAAVAVGASADFSPLGFINYVVPLDTILNFLAGYATLRLVCAGIRMIKSFIPLIS